MLFILSKSPTEDNYDTVLKIAENTGQKGEKPAVLHIQDACISATTDRFCKKLAAAGIEAYALKADCEARGLSKKICKNIKIIDYKSWVKLVMNEHDRIISWTS